MKPAVLIIGAGPYGCCLAKEFKERGFSVVINTIEEDSLDKLESLGYYPIWTPNLHEESCSIIYQKTMSFLEDNSLQLKCIVHTSRFALYEFNNNGYLPDDIKDEMYKVNSESPYILAKYFYETGCQFVFTSSGASQGFSKDLGTHALPAMGKKIIGTRGLKNYSYTKRLGEEKLYNFFKEKNQLNLLTIIYISVMHGTNFFRDMNVNNPKGRGWSANKTANFIVKEILKGNNRIYPGFKAMALKIFPSFINRLILHYTIEKFYPLTKV